jgi:hypothetical protein
MLLDGTHHKTICGSLRSLDLPPLFFMNRNLARSFIRAVNWATVQNIDLLMNGKITKSMPLRVDLGDMTEIVNPELALKRLRNLYGSAVYSMKDYNRQDIGASPKFFHDCYLRDCLAKFLHGKEFDFSNLLIKGSPDATITGKETLYFEFDNGHQDKKMLADKLQTHYLKDGSYRVIFFMGDREKKAHLEKARLDKLFEIVKTALPKKKGRILGACYSQYLIDGKIYNWKGEECEL